MNFEEQQRVEAIAVGADPEELAALTHRLRLFTPFLDDTSVQEIAVNDPKAVWLWKAGVWEKLHRLLLDELRGADEIDFSRVVVDSTSVRAVHGGKKRDRAPWTAARTGRSTTWLSTPMAFRWPAHSLRPIATT